MEGDIPNLSIGVGIGIFAEWERSDVWKQNLYDIPVSPFTVGFATIGPIISIGTVSNLRVVPSSFWLVVLGALTLSFSSRYLVFFSFSLDILIKMVILTFGWSRNLK